VSEEIITQEMIHEFNQDLAQSGAIFRLRKDERNLVSIQPSNSIWLYRGGCDGACIINLSDEFYCYLETFFTKKDDTIKIHYNNTRSVFWACRKGVNKNELCC
jgi:hypothetical protein